MSEEIKKRPFTPQRSMVSLIPGSPKMWLCNLKKTHNPNITINGESPDYPTARLDCFCIECLEMDEELYRIGRPVQASGSVDEKELARDYVGVWFTQKGYAQHKKERARCRECQCGEPKQE